MTLPKPPQFVGTAPDAPDPNLNKAAGVAKYKEEVAARQAEKLASAPQGPSITGANAVYDPKRDGSRTMADIEAVQRAVDQPVSTEGVRLSDMTTKGLKEIRDASQAAQAAPAPKPGDQPPAPAPFVPAAEAEAPPAPKNAQLGHMDDFELDRLMQFASMNQEDVINNTRERDAVEKRLEPISLIAGITTGEFTQDVGIVPEQFVVRYRAVTPEEDHAIRLLLVHMTAKQANLITLESSLYQMLTLAAGVDRINDMRMPTHYTRKGFIIEVEPDALQQKLRYFLGMPLPMAHALGVHQFWFDQRVRKLFTSADLGNG